MRTKKIIAFLLAAVMIMSQTVLISAEEQNDNKKIVLLDKLGIISDILDRDVKYDDYITRAEFVSCIVKILGIEADGAKNAGHFVDIPSDYKYAGAVNAAYEQGIITSMYGKFFVPEAPLKTEQGAKMVMSMLGYDALAQNKGGYPDGYMYAASTSGVLKESGAAAGAYITYDKAFTILYNALHTNMMITTIEDGRPKNEVRDGETLMTSVMEIEKAEGQITATQYTSLDSAEGISEGKIAIDGVVYDDYTQDAHLYLGFLVDYYYIADEAAIVAVVPRKNTDVITVKAEDIVSYENFTYTYNVGEKSRTKAFSAKTTVIYNGRLVDKDYDRVNYVPSAGEVRFIDGDGDGKYEMLSILSYETVVVNGVVASERLITDKNDIARNIEIEDLQDVFCTIKNKKGEEISFNEIKPENVISAAISLDSVIYDLIVSTEKMDGTVKSVSYDKDEPTVNIDGEEYGLSKDRLDFLANIQAGDEGTFCFDAFGNAAYFKKNMSGRYQYGYLKNVYYDEAEEILTAKILDAEGNFNKYTTETKLVLNDGVVSGDGEETSSGKKITAKAAYEILQNEPQIIMYMTNSAGSLTKIQTTDGNILRNLYNSGVGSGLKYWSSSRTFDAKVPVADSAVVFILPSDTELYGDDIYYSAKKRAYLSNNNRYVFETYNNDEKSDFARAVVVYKSYNAPVVDQGVALVKNISTTVNEYDELVSKLTVLYMGAEFEFATLNEDTIYKASAEDGSKANMTIEAGDVIRFAQSPEDYIEEIKVVYDYSEKRYMGSPTSSQLDAQYRSLFGSVYSVEDNIAKIYVNEYPIKTDKDTSHTVEYYPVDKFKIYVYDTTQSKKNIYIGNANDLMDYVHYGQKYSTVVIQTRNGEPGAMIIYKEN